MAFATRDPAEYFHLSHLQSVEGDNAWYSNQRFLGRGGNGTAFLVTATSGDLFGIQLVLKVLHRISDETRRAAFLEETRILQQLAHPAIIRIFDEGVFSIGDRKHPFAVVEYVPSTARQLLDAGRIDRLIAIRIVMNCLSALQTLHGLSQPICHRDIKPENILIGPAGAKLADFGLAKVLSSSSISGTTADGACDDEVNDLSQWPGMPFAYRTPEQIARIKDRARGVAPTVEVSPASDIYQLGTVFYELLTGFNPQRRRQRIDDDIELDLRALHGVQAGALDKLIAQMLERDPSARPTAAACLQRLNPVHKDFCAALREATGQDV